MAKGKLGNAINIAHLLIKNYVQAGNIVLDSTAGNGKDTKFLAEIVGPTGLVYGFDIQAKAISNTRELLTKHGLERRVKLINDSHSNIDKYINTPLDFVVYNLGYLPGTDKTIATRAFSTISSIKKSLDLLKKGGLILVVSYIGHGGGLEEKNEIENYFMSLKQTEYNIIRAEFINQANMPPLLFIIEKI